MVSKVISTNSKIDKTSSKVAKITVFPGYLNMTTKVN